MMKLSVCIPAFNEEENVSTTVSEILSAASGEDGVNDVEIIVIDDHSDDNTRGAVLSIADSRVKCLRLSKRSGSHVALRAGLDHAQGDAVLCISCDGQDDPVVLGNMLSEWQKGAKIVWALRENRVGEPMLVQLCAGLFYKILDRFSERKSKSSIDLSRVDFYLLDRDVVEAVKSCRERNTSLFGLINWVGFKGVGVSYKRRERRKGQSKWNFTSRLNLAWDWIVSFSGVPLKMVSALGFATATLGFLFTVYVVINSIIGKPVEGWSSIICFILIIGGLQMIILGVFGEYLWRSVEEARKRPLYFIEKES